MSDKNRIGVFLCHCGGNISDNVDLYEIEEKLSENDEICSVKHHENLCSLEGRNIIKDQILREDLDRVVISACSKITHGATFQNYIKPLNPYLFEMPNVREQCSWVTDNKDKSTRKALSLINSAIETVKHNKPLKKIPTRVKDSVLVIGAGISGITAANSLAKQGMEVTLIEKRPAVGGAMIQVGKVFTPDKMSEDCAACLLNPVIDEMVHNKNITLLTNTVLEKSSRNAGNFDVILRRKPDFIDEDKCTSCGKCTQVCPSFALDEWNEGLNNRKAIYKPFPQAVPSTYTLDDESCVKCGACLNVCPTNAINLDAIDEIISLTVGAVVIATGHQRFDTNKRPEYGHPFYEDVLSQMQLARLMGINGPTNGHLTVPSTGKVPRRVVMIQCVGSRDQMPDGHKYCSKVCCMVALKNANLIHSHYPDTEVIICYTDIRTPGVYEKYFKYVQNNGIKLIRGRPGEIAREDDHLIVRIEDTLTHNKQEIPTDLVVLSAALESSQGTIDAAKTLGVPLTEDLFVKEKHPKMQPVATDIEGIFVCGTAQGPKDITDSIIQANTASTKISELINGGLEVEPHIATINVKKCVLCGQCVENCRYQALSIYHNSIRVGPIACTGCGDCIITCPEEAISIQGQSDERLEAGIKGLLKDKNEEEQVIIAFLDDIGNVSANNMGINRVECPSSVRIINVPFINRVKYKHIKYALTHGADGVFLGEYPDSPRHNEIRENVQEMKKHLEEDGINPERLLIHSVFIPYFRGLAKQFKDFDELLNTLTT